MRSAATRRGDGRQPRRREHPIARARRAGDELVAAGRLAWDGVHVAGLVERALAGEDAAPPLRLGR